MSSEQRNGARKPHAFEIYVYRTTLAAAGNSSSAMSRAIMLSNQQVGEYDGRTVQWATNHHGKS